MFLHTHTHTYRYFTDHFTEVKSIQDQYLKLDLDLLK